MQKSPIIYKNQESRNICFFLASISGRGGTERVASIIANGFAQDGHTVYFLSLYAGRESCFSLHESVNLVELYAANHHFKWKYFSIISKLRKFLVTHKIDVLISTDSIMALYSVPACLNTKVFHIVWEHFNFLTNFGLLSRRISRYLAARKSNLIIVLTKQDLLLWKEKARATVNIISIPNPIFFHPIDPSPERWHNKCVIAVGRLHFQKGFDLLITCWKKIAAVAPDWKLYIIGDGPERSQLGLQIVEAGLCDAVKIMPFSVTISNYYLQASIFCLSSRFEGLPMVLLEAQAFALPAVCFNCYTGPSEVIADNVNGFLVNNSDMEEFCDSIIRLIRDEELRGRFGLNAVRMAERFEKENVLDQWRNILLLQSC